MNYHNRFFFMLCFALVITSTNFASPTKPGQQTNISSWLNGNNIALGFGLFGSVLRFTPDIFTKISNHIFRSNSTVSSEQKQVLNLIGTCITLYSCLHLYKEINRSNALLEQSQNHLKTTNKRLTKENLQASNSLEKKDQELNNKDQELENKDQKILHLNNLLAQHQKLTNIQNTQPGLRKTPSCPSFAWQGVGKASQIQNESSCLDEKRKK